MAQGTLVDMQVEDGRQLLDQLARDGFPVYPLMSEIITEHEAEYRRFPSSVPIYLPQGRPPKVGEVFVQKDLAATMQYMVDQEAAVASKQGREAGLEAARAAFYRGDIAQKIVKFQKENGGFLSAADLAACLPDPEWARGAGRLWRRQPTEWLPGARGWPEYGYRRHERGFAVVGWADCAAEPEAWQAARFRQLGAVCG